MALTEQGRRRREEFLTLSPQEVRLRDQKRRQEREFQRLDALAQDQAVCERPECGHKRVSHGSFHPGGAFAGIGLGQCGMEGPTYDPCPCSEFQTAAPVPVL